MAAAGYFLPGLVHGDIRSRQYTTSRRKEEGNGEMGECSKEKETRKEKGGAKKQSQESGRGGTLCVSFVAGFRLQ